MAPTVKDEKAPPVVAAWMNLTKNLIGAGIFSLPSGLKSGSVIPGLSAMLTVCIFCSSSFILIAYLCKRLRCETYREVFCTAFGKSTGLLIDGFICTNGFFACVAYTILVADFLQKAAEGLLGTVPNRVVLIICNTCCFMLPLSHAKDLSALRYTSMMGLLIIAFVFMFIVSDCWKSEDAASNLKAHALHLNMGIFRTVALCTGAFQAHYNAPRIFKQLHGDLAAHAQTVAASFGTALTIYALFAVSGLGLFGDRLLGNVLRNYDPDNTAIMMVWFGMAFAIIFTYPLVFTAARESLIGSQPSLQDFLRQKPFMAHVTITCTMVCCISFVACCVEDVSKVTGTLGAVVGSSLCWICPSSVYLKLSQKGRSSLSQPLTEKPCLPSYGPLKVYTSFLIMVGSISIVVGVHAVWSN